MNGGLILKNTNGESFRRRYRDKPFTGKYAGDLNAPKWLVGLLPEAPVCEPTFFSSDGKKKPSPFYSLALIVQVYGTQRESWTLRRPRATATIKTEMILTITFRPNSRDA